MSAEEQALSGALAARTTAATNLQAAADAWASVKNDMATLQSNRNRCSLTPESWIISMSISGTSINVPLPVSDFFILDGYKPTSVMGGDSSVANTVASNNTSCRNYIADILNLQSSYDSKQQAFISAQQTAAVAEDNYTSALEAFESYQFALMTPEERIEFEDAKAEGDYLTWKNKSTRQAVYGVVIVLVILGSIFIYKKYIK